MAWFEGGLGLGHVGGGQADLGPPGLDLLARDQAGVLGDDRLAALEAGLGVGLGGHGLVVGGLGRLDGQLDSARSRSRPGPGRRVGEAALGEEDPVDDARRRGP